MSGTCSHPFYYHDNLDLWKENCEKSQKQFYNGYGGAQFHCFDCSHEKGRTLLKERISLALFGSPKDFDAVSQFAKYNLEQQLQASELMNRICEQYEKKTQATVELITIFVCCKSFVNESIHPVFRVRVDLKTIKYIDTSKRVYENWKDWLDNNNLPSMKCYPMSGYYSCKMKDENSKEVHYDKNKSPVVEFANLPTTPTTLTRRAVHELLNQTLFFNDAEMRYSAGTISAFSEYLQNYKLAMMKQYLRWADAKRNGDPSSTFDRFLYQTHGFGSIVDLTGKIELLGQIKNPAHLFNGLTNADTIAIDAANKKALLISIPGTERMPTKVSIDETLFNSFESKTPRHFEMILALRGHKEFASSVLKYNEMKPYQAHQLKKALLVACGKKPFLVKAAVFVSKRLIATKILPLFSISDFCAVAELVRLYEPPSSSENSFTADRKKKCEYLIHKGGKEFINGIIGDIIQARSIVDNENPGILFESDLKSVYHFRKHRGEFGSCTMRYYLCVLPEKLFKAVNLRTVAIGNGIISEEYCTPSTASEEDKHMFGKLLKIPGNAKPVMTTLHRDEGKCISKYNDTWATIRKRKAPSKHQS